MGNCYDFSKWHPDCGDIDLAIGPGGSLYLYCPKCRVLADAEAVSAKISPLEASKVDVEREVAGKQTKGLDKGEVLKP